MPSLTALRRPRALLASGLLALAAAAAATAQAAPPAPTISGANGQFWNAANPTPTYTITPAAGGTITWSASNGGGGTGGPGEPVAVSLSPIGDGPGSLTATQAVPEDPEVSPAATRTFTVDRIAPSISVSLSGASQNGWWRELRINWTCSDAHSGVPASCSADETSFGQGAGQTRSRTPQDFAGNVGATRTTPHFNFDGLGPRQGNPLTPTPGAVVASEPVFAWTAGGDATSGLLRYEVLVRGIPGQGDRVVASVGPSTLSSGRNAWGQALPEGRQLTWWVRTVDVAGNETISRRRTFTIDSTVPPPPAFTGGPDGLTNVAAPVFSWTGTQPAYAWNVSEAGGETAIQSGGGPATQAALAALPDGAYTLSVAQVSAAGALGIEATRSFQIDATPPAAPTITGRPGFPATTATPAFSWTAEPGASSRWQVVGSGGSSVQGPSDTPGTSVTVGPLPAGSYVFRVLQIDAAGNASATTSDPFTIVGAASTTRTSAATTALPRRNAARLRPRAGRVLPTRRPVLQWSRGPAGTKLYNVQIFKVVRKRLGKTPVVKKVLSAFPRGRQYRVPEAKMLPGTCYVWRVWPYLGRRFTSEPLGISNFCIASRKVLAKTAARARARASSVH